MISQKEAVFGAVTEVLGSFSGTVNLTTEQRKEVIGIVVAGFMNGSVELSSEAASKYDNEAKLKQYANGLVSNWLRKDKRLNGGSKYITKNPGSRAGSTDDTLKALQALRKSLTDPEQIKEVEFEIAQRTAAIKASKLPKIEINTNLIPESLRHLVG
jgi:hypothetical protein